jgi:hypothetical protein
MPFLETEERTPILPLTQLVGRGGFAGYLLLGIEVMRIASIRGRDPSEYAEVDGSALLQIVYVGSCLFYGIYHWARAPQRGAFYLLKASPALPLVLYAGLCVLSTLWSPNPAITLYRSTECVAYIVLIAIVCDNLNLRCSKQDLVEWIVFWSMWFLAWDIVRVIRVMGFGVFSTSYAFRAGNFGLAMAFFLTLFISRRRLFALINSLFMILSLANTAYFGVFLGLVPGLCVGDRRSQIILFFLTCVVVLTLLLAGSDVLRYTLFYGQEGVGIQYTSGRSQVWSYSLTYGMDRLLCGYGFVAGETNALRTAGAAAITAHNVMLSAFLNVGILGPVLFLVFFVWLARLSLCRSVPKKWRPAFVGTTIMVFVTSIASPGLGARVYGAWLPAVLVSLAISTLAKSDVLRELNAVSMGGIDAMAMEGRFWRASVHEQ